MPGAAGAGERSTFPNLDAEPPLEAGGGGSSAGAQLAPGADELLDAAGAWLRSAEGDASFSRLAALLVPRLGDFCTIDAVRDGRLVRVAAVHREPARAWVLRDLGVGAPGASGASSLPPARVASSGEAALHPELLDPALDAMCRDDAELGLLRELRPTSSVAVPLSIGGDVRGVLWLGVAGSGRRFCARDQLLAEQVASHAALHLERERLRAESRLEAERLRALLHLEAGRLREESTDLRDQLAREREGRQRAEAERERIRFELREAMHVRETFLAIASHELRTPLTGLQLAVQSAGQVVGALPLSPRVEQAISRIGIADKQVRKLCGLVDRLLDVARIELGTVDLYPTDVDLCQLVAGVVGRFQEEASRAGCALEVRLRSPVHGRWDPSRLEEVISSLISNAIKFGAGQPVIVEVGLDRGLASVSVTDRGPGIEPANQALIFERFERAGAPLHHGGLGLGLWLARHIVQACGGQLAVSSEVGVGSTFVAALPLHPNDRALVAA